MEGVVTLLDSPHAAIVHDLWAELEQHALNLLMQLCTWANS